MIFTSLCKLRMRGAFFQTMPFIQLTNINFVIHYEKEKIK